MDFSMSGLSDKMGLQEGGKAVLKGKIFLLAAGMCLTLGMTGCTVKEMNEISDKSAFTETASQTENPVENRVASFSTKGAKGSCIILYAKDGEYIVATASHVAEKLEEVSIDGQAALVTEYGRSPDFDLIFVRAQMNGTEEDKMQCETVTLEAYNELKEGDMIVICGSVADEKVYQEGKVLSPWIYMEDFGYHMLWGEVSDVRGGMSGGGVFDGNGRLVGMIVGGDADKQIAVMPISILAAEWKNSDLDAPIDIFLN